MREPKKKIILIGMMGSGKSTVGAELAKEFQIKFEDTDLLIEKTQGKSISDLILSRGENSFRNIETALLEGLVENKDFLSDGFVLSTGGGIVLRERNRSLLRELGKIIWLSASVETLYERLKDFSDRPLLETSGKTDEEAKLQKIKDILNAREKIYKEASDVEIKVDGLTLSDIIKKIRMFL